MEFIAASTRASKWGELWANGYSYSEIHAWLVTCVDGADITLDAVKDGVAASLGSLTLAERAIARNSHVQARIHARLDDLAVDTMGGLMASDSWQAQAKGVEAYRKSLSLGEVSAPVVIVNNNSAAIVGFEDVLKRMRANSNAAAIEVDVVGEVVGEAVASVPQSVPQGAE